MESGQTAAKENKGQIDLLPERLNEVKEIEIFRSPFFRENAVPNNCSEIVSESKIFISHRFVRAQFL